MRLAFSVRLGSKSMASNIDVFRTDDSVGLPLLMIVGNDSSTRGATAKSNNGVPGVLAKCPPHGHLSSAETTAPQDVHAAEPQDGTAAGTRGVTILSDDFSGNPSGPGAQKRRIGSDIDPASGSRKVIILDAHEGQTRDRIVSLEEGNLHLKEALVIAYLQLSSLALGRPEASFIGRDIPRATHPTAMSATQEDVRNTANEEGTQVARLTQDKVYLEKMRDRLKQRLQSAISIIRHLEDTNTTLLQLVRELTEEDL
ncbi:hypothetical protein C8R46DRAFT_1212491 [Mycena filopes]|nr:hypothetical protein C8R46DRAFT_1212491 [Mycena filopes]